MEGIWLALSVLWMRQSRSGAGDKDRADKKDGDSRAVRWEVMQSSGLGRYVASHMVLFLEAGHISSLLWTTCPCHHQRASLQDYVCPTSSAVRGGFHDGNYLYRRATNDVSYKRSERAVNPPSIMEDFQSISWIFGGLE